MKQLRQPDPRQLALDFDGRPRTAEELHRRLRELGLTTIDKCRLTRNRAVMVSFRSRELRIHEGYLSAPRDVLKAIVTFVEGRTRTQRRAARRMLLGFPIETATAAERRRERPDPRDARMAKELTEWHATLNAGYFEGKLRAIEVRVSRRMRSRLGHYTAASAAGEPAEIVISRRHYRRHGREEALNTLLHEMIHQWQDESGLEIDHGPVFRAKAREVGVTPAARRLVGSGLERMVPLEKVIALRAARED